MPTAAAAAQHPNGGGLVFLFLNADIAVEKRGQQGLPFIRCD
jgi:hypothetical protein